MAEADGAAGTVYVVGSLHLDVIVDAPRLPARDETLSGSAVAYAFGGKGGNQAVAAAQHGARSVMAGRVGGDDFARPLLARLDEAGVDRRQVQRDDGASGMSVAIVEAGGDYGAVIVSAANLRIDPDALDLPRGTPVVVLQNEVPEAVNLAAARLAWANDAPVVLNAAPARPMADELLDLVTLLVVNRVEAAMLAGVASVATAAEAEAAARTLATGRRSVLVTLGGDGVVLALPNGEAEAVPAFAVEVVSTHGAGDAFVGALAARIAAGDTTPAAIRYAQAAAALHVSLPVTERKTIAPAMVAAFLAGRGTR